MKKARRNCNEQVLGMALQATPSEGRSITFGTTNQPPNISIADHDGQATSDE